MPGSPKAMPALPALRTPPGAAPRGASPPRARPRDRALLTPGSSGRQRAGCRRCGVFGALAKAERKQLQGLPLKGKHTPLPTPCSRPGAGVGAPRPPPALQPQPEPRALPGAVPSPSTRLVTGRHRPGLWGEPRGTGCPVGDAKMSGVSPTVSCSKMCARGEEASRCPTRGLAVGGGGAKRARCGSSTSATSTLWELHEHVIRATGSSGGVCALGSRGGTVPRGSASLGLSRRPGGQSRAGRARLSDGSAPGHRDGARTFGQPICWGTSIHSTTPAPSSSKSPGSVPREGTAAVPGLGVAERPAGPGSSSSVWPDPVPRRPGPALRFVVLWRGNEARGPGPCSCRRSGRRQTGKKTRRAKINGKPHPGGPGPEPVWHRRHADRERRRPGHGVICHQPAGPTLPRPPWEAWLGLLGDRGSHGSALPL